MRTTIVAVALLATGCAGLQFGGADRQRETAESVRESVKGTTPAYAKYDPEGQKLWKLTRAFYEQREFLPAWIEGTSPRPQMKALMRALSAAEHEGLDPELYTVSMLEKKHSEATRGFLTDKGFDPAEAGTLDVWLTYLYLRYASDLADGLSNLVHADKAWQIAPEKFDARAHLEAALDANRVEESLAELTPRNGEYGRLRELLARYREQKARGGWPLMPNVRLKPGQKSAHVATLAMRLAASGDYTGPIPQAGIASPYSPGLQAAVKVFQRRHGLADDGIVGPAAIAALNVPIDQRIEQVAMNMERWRWLPRDLGERYILVNIPEMRLDVYESGTIPLSMRVVVGKSETPTPIFNDRMTYLVFSPYWNVPPGIAEGETLPALLNDPDFLARNNMEVLDASGNIVDPETMDLTDPTAYRFRQKPGTHNSLGLVKFMFPNQFNVYLHDTPSGSLFERATRSFSHGCVRVEDPVALARYLLRDQPAWTADRIRDAMHAGQETSVKLKTPIPVYLGYWTARVRPDNTVQFRPDVYRVDRRLSARLDDRLERLRKTAAAAAKATTVEK